MTNLVIVESPAKTKSIQSYLGDGWLVTASFGHFRDLPTKEMGVEPPTFKPKYVVSENGKRTLDRMKQLAEKADNIYLATDLDREGEAIAWHIQDALKLKNPKRITFGEISKKAIEKAIASPRDINMNLVRAQEGRRVLDRLVGYMVSPALSNKAGRSGLSAGRVQSPAVRIIVDREREIRAFVSTEHYSVLLGFDGDIYWTAELDTKPLLKDDQEYLTDKNLVESLLNIKQVLITDIIKKESKRSAPAAFITSTLQQAGSVALGLSPKETMAHGQVLFDKGFITYHRTDKLNLSEDSINEIRAFAKANGYAELIPDKPNVWKSGESSQEAHEAIRPTDFNLADGQTGDPKRDQLYQLIRLRALASQFKPAVYDTTKITLTANIDGADYTFIAKGEVELEKGWKTLMAGDQTSEELEEKTQALPELQTDQMLNVSEAKTLTKSTKPPSRYTEASLVRKMESEGIGRPATYASILDNIKSKGYVDIEKRKLVPTDLGELVVDALTDNFQFIELNYTKEVETRLDALANGQSEYLPIISDLHSVISKEIAAFHQSEPLADVKQCPACQKPMTLRSGKFGKFWACTGFPDCKTTEPVIDEKAKPCPKCDDGKLIKRKGQYGDFYGCSNYPTCKHIEQTKSKKPKKK